jgi:hypothetical protein
VTDIFQEVEENLREERAKSLWSRSWPWLLGVFVIAVAAVGGWEFWKWRRADTAAKASESYLTALDHASKGETDAALAELDKLIKSGPDGYKTLAFNVRSALLLDKNDVEGARKSLEQAAVTGPDEELRALARLRAAYLSADSSPLDQLKLQLAGVSDREDTIGFAARELIAAKAFAVGQTQEARKIYDVLALAPEAPESIRQRAEIARALLKAGPGAAPPAPAGAPPTVPPQPSQPTAPPTPVPGGR